MNHSSSGVCISASFAIAGVTQYLSTISPPWASPDAAPPVSADPLSDWLASDGAVVPPGPAQLAQAATNTNTNTRAITFFISYSSLI